MSLLGLDVLLDKCKPPEYVCFGPGVCSWCELRATAALFTGHCGPDVFSRRHEVILRHWHWLLFMKSKADVIRRLTPKE